MTVWLGTSGWSYRHWRGVFYPEGVAQKKWLDYYAERFSTVEINATFYRLPATGTFADWAARVPGGFRFSLKVPRFQTHAKRLLDPVEGWERLAAGCEPLGSRLGVHLAQLPPRFRVDPDRLAAFLAAAPEGSRVAVEFRDRAWFVPEVEAVLRAHGAALVWSDFPGSAAPEWSTAPFLYVRRHGAIGRYAGRYGTRRLADLAATFEAFDGDVYCYFNNDAEGAAVDDAAELAAILGD